jgi:hypothetical protein
MCIIFNGTKHSVTGEVKLCIEKMKRGECVLKVFFSNRLCNYCSSFCTSVASSHGMNYPRLVHVGSVVDKVALAQVLHTVFQFSPVNYHFSNAPHSVIILLCHNRQINASSTKRFSHTSLQNCNK